MAHFRWKAAAYAAALIAACGAARADTFTLNDALALAYETNPQLDAQRAAQRATDENVAQANANWRPQVSVSGSYGYEGIHGGLGPGTFPLHPLTSGVSVTEPIFRGGRTYAEIKKAKAVVRAGRAQLVATEQDVLLSAVTAYMDVVRDEATLKLKQNNVGVLQKQFDATQEQFKVGELTRTDVAQSQARLAGAQADFVNAQGQLAVSRSNFEHAVGRPAPTLEALPAMPKLPGTQESAIEIASNTNPVLIEARENEHAADYAVDDALGVLLPQVSVTGQYQYSQGSFTGFTLGAQHIESVIGQVTVPIYQGGAEDSAVRQAKQQLGQARLSIADTERQVVDATRSSWQGFVTAKATIESNKSQVAANEIAYDGVKQEQQVGSRTIIEVLNAQQELLNAQVAVVSSERDTYVAAYQLLDAMGLLTAKSLGLRVKLYNPEDYYDDNASRWIGLGD